MIIYRFFFLFLLSFSSLAVNLSKEMHYRKIFMRLTGTDPSPEEYRLFKDRTDECPDQVCIEEELARQARRAMASPYFKGKAIDFVDSLLDIKRDYSNRIYYESDGKFAGDNLANLTLDIFENNRNWDFFFRGNRLKTSDRSITYSRIIYGDRAYLTNHLPQPLPPGGGFEVIFQEDFLKAGFALTTLFNIRYTSNPVNERRGRAAAIIRAGLCDILFPEVDLDEAHRRIEDQIAQGRSSGTRERDTSLHGERPDCAQCHLGRGLDPLAQTLWATETFLSPLPVPGRFVHTTREGVTINTPVEGLGQWMDVLVDTTTYERCQVSHFWSFFVGDKRTLEGNGELFRQVLDEFNDRGRRVLDFIEYLVLSEEFRRLSPTSLNTDPLWAEAQESVEMCSSCHSVPRTEEWAQEAVEEISNGTMPPSPLRLSLQGQEALLLWIRGGMPGPGGERAFESSDSGGLLDSSSGENGVVTDGGGEELSFWGGHRRYLSSFDLLRFLERKFSAPPSTDDSCEVLANSVSSGAVSRRRNEGRPVSEPGEDFVLLYRDCVHGYADSDMWVAWWMEGGVSGDSLLDRWIDDDPFFSGKRPYWDELTNDVKKDALERLLQRFVGPPFVLRELGFIGDDPGSYDHLLNELSTLPVICDESSFDCDRLDLIQATALITVAILSREALLIH